MSDQDRINQLFNNNSKAFGEATEHQYKKGTYKRGELFLSQIQLSTHLKHGRILDYGCGTGRISMMLGEKGYTVVGVDPAQEHVDMACALNKQINVTFKVLGNKLEEADSFDAVVSSSVLEFVPDAEAYVESMTRVLKPGGIVLVSVPNVYSLWRLYSRLRFGRKYKHFQFQKNLLGTQELNDLFARHGFEPIGDRKYFESAFDHKGLSFLNKSILFGTLVLLSFVKK